MWADLSQWFQDIYSAGDTLVMQCLQWVWSLLVGIIHWFCDPSTLAKAGFAFAQGIEACLKDVLPSSCDSSITAFFSALAGSGPAAATRLALYFIDHFVDANVFVGILVATLISLPCAMVIRLAVYAVEHIWSGAGA